MRVGLGEVVSVFVGGGLGALSRWVLSGLVQERLRNSIFPWGTLVVNIAGSLLLGFIMGATIQFGVFSRMQRLLLATGFAGSFTTFSTFEYESFRLAGISTTLAIANIGLSVLLGFLGVYAGYVVAGLVYR